MADTVLRHPNREKPAVQATRIVVTVLLVASTALIALVLFGSWASQVEGAKWVTIGYIGIYAIMAFFVLRWKNGVLPMAAAAALGFVAMTAPTLGSWFERTKPGFTTPWLPPEITGLLIIAIIVLQVMLMAATMVGFQQGWNIEVEERAMGSGEDDGGWDDDDGRSEPPSDGGDEQQTRVQDPAGARS